MSRPLLILRPEPEAQATAERARSLGLKPIVCPLFGGVAVPWDQPEGQFDAIMVTSAAAIRFGGVPLSAYHGLPLYAVGAATAEAARVAGFAEVHAGGGGVDAVIARIAADSRNRVLYLAGRDQTAHAEPPFEYVTVIVYAMDPLPPPALPADAVALIHSKRAGERLAEIIRDRATIDVVAISSKAASGAGTGWRSVRWPDEPTDAAMLALAAPLCEG